MSNHGDLHEALDRLAGAADTDFTVDPMPGIRAEARRNRNRTAVLASTGLAAAVVVAYAVLSAGPDATRSDDSGIASSPSVSDSPSPTVSDSPTDGGTETGSTPPLEPLETRRGDIDGDGTPDRVRLLVQPGTPGDEPSDEAWLEVRTASGTQTVQVTDFTTYVGFYEAAGLADLDGNGAAEILLVETGGGESGGLSVWTWSVDHLDWARNYADGTPRRLVNDSGALAIGGEELGVVFQDGTLSSWQVVEPGSQEVTVWEWLLDGGVLGAFEQPGTQCVSFGVLSPC